MNNLKYKTMKISDLQFVLLLQKIDPNWDYNSIRNVTRYICNSEIVATAKFTIIDREINIREDIIEKYKVKEDL